MTAYRLQFLGFAFLLVAAFGQGACTSPLDTYFCSTDNDCGSEKNGVGHCEPSSLCSYPDLICPSGQRYSVYAGESREQCVRQSFGADAGISDCDELFGHVSEYVNCAETEDLCTFSVELNFESCTDICESLGSICIWAESNDPDSGSVCTNRGKQGDACDSIHYSAICECSLDDFQF